MGEAVPHLIERLVYVSAYVPVNAAPNGAAVSALPEGQPSVSGAVLIGDPTATGAMRINPRDSDPDYVEKGRSAFYNDLSTDEYLRFAAYLNPPAAAGGVRRRPGHPRAMGQDPPDLRPLHRGP